MMRRWFGVSCLVFALGACAASSPAPTAEVSGTRVAFYVGIEGLTFSTTGATYNKYPDYADQEIVVRVTEATARSMVESLQAAGFFEDSGRAPPKFTDLPPESFTIAVDDGTREHDLFFYYAKEHTVPEPYLAVLEGQASQSPVARRFLRLNRDPRVALQAHESPAWPPRGAKR